MIPAADHEDAPPPPDPYQEAAGTADALVTQALTAMRAAAPDQVEAVITGAMMALSRFYAREMAMQNGTVTARQICVGLDPILHKHAQTIALAVNKSHRNSLI